jgi:predicted solute-binding protein
MKIVIRKHIELYVNNYTFKLRRQRDRERPFLFCFEYGLAKI